MIPAATSASTAASSSGSVSWPPQRARNASQAPAKHFFFSHISCPNFSKNLSRHSDAKYMRTHKRIKASPPPIGSDPVIFDILMGVKTAVDQKVLKNQRIMDNHAYFTREIMPTIIQSCRNNGVQPSMAQVNFIDTYISGEYFAERTWIS